MNDLEKAAMLRAVQKAQHDIPIRRAIARGERPERRSYVERRVNGLKPRSDHQDVRSGKERSDRYLLDPPYDEYLARGVRLLKERAAKEATKVD